jgi:hypothetical protein
VLPREVVPVVGELEVIFEAPEVVTVQDEIWDTAVFRRFIATPAAVTPPPEVSFEEFDESDESDTAAVQDEWGFFDPSKCGFSALLAKLDEITDEEKHGNSEAESTVRLVTHY